MLNYAQKLKDEAAKVGAYLVVTPERVSLSNFWLLDAELAKKMQRVPTNIWRHLQAQNMAETWAASIRA